MADKQIKDFTAQSPVEYTNKYVTQDVSNNTKYTQHSVLLGGWHGGVNRWSDNAYYDGAWKYRTTGYAASMYNNSGTLEFYSNTGSAGAVISWNSANILAKKITSNDTTDSSSTSTGAGIFSGGVGIAKTLYVGLDGYFLGGDVTIGDTSANSYLHLMGADGTASSIRSYGTSGEVWRFGKVATTNDFRIQRYIAGVLQDFPLIIENATGDITLTNISNFTDTTDSSSTSTGSVIISGGVGIAKKLYVGTDGHIGGVLYGESITDSTSSVTGGCIFSGGVGIAKKLYVGTDSHTAGVLYGDSVTDSSSISTGGAIFSGGVGIAKKLYVGGIGNFTNTTDSTSAITGGCILSGGVGIAKNIYSTGTGITLDNSTNPSLTIKTLDASTGLTVYQGTSGIVWRSGKHSTGNNYVVQRYIAGVLQDTPLTISNSTGAWTVPSVINHTNTTDSTSSTTGSMIISGGVGIAKKLYVGTDFHAAGKIYGDDTTDSGSTSTGSVIIAGGVGIAKKLYVGSTIYASSIFNVNVITGETSNQSAGVYGKNTNSTSGPQNPGVQGESTSGHGVFGKIDHSGTYAAVYGYSTSTTGTPIGVFGQCLAGIAVKGSASASGATAIYGESTTGSGIGAHGRSVSGYGVYGESTAGTSSAGVYGLSTTGIGVLGNGATYDFYASGAGTDYGTSSSIRWKDKVKTIENPLELIEKIRGVRYKDNRYNMIDKIGYIAEEIREVLPEIVVEEDPANKENWYKEDGEKKLYCSGLDYSKLGPLHTEAIKELYKIVKSLEMLIKEKK